MRRSFGRGQRDTAYIDVHPSSDFTLRPSMSYAVRKLVRGDVVYMEYRNPARNESLFCGIMKYVDQSIASKETL